MGVLSIGEMGMGIAKLLIARGYRVVTNVEGRRSVFFIMSFLFGFSFLSLVSHSCCSCLCIFDASLVQ